MRREAIAGLDVVITGGTDRAGGGDGPLVVLLHGFGAPGEDLVGLWRAVDVPPAVRFAFPAGLIALPPGYGGGRAWWPIDFVRLERAVASGELHDLSRETPEGLPEARQVIAELCRQLAARLDAAPERMVLGGFSQGAMLACDVALHEPSPPAGLVLLSGTLLAEDEWRRRAATRRGLAVFQSHGRHDPLLPFALAERLRDLLREAGAEVDWHPFSGGHEIPFPVVEALGAFLTRVAGSDGRESA